MNSSRQVDIRRVGTSERTSLQDLVAVEEPLEVRVNRVPFAVIMRTPGADRELAAGFLLAEDVIRASHELGAIEHCSDVDDHARQNTLNVTILDDAVHRLSARLAERRQVTMTSSCGLCGRRTIESLRSRASRVQGNWAVSSALVCTLPGALREAQALFHTTGGLHAAALFGRDGTLQVVAEDVGRHNAVDKVIGRRLLEDALPLDH
ncbi:MAG TPA: formate dehydrogenase accessory sulfurtransferase FdhD [Vicinamibacterales bacterium]|nr:formate dehydrogenase accessory sulfurtransferase FdhD [Vicinamibacterales bacterium]